LINYIFYFFSLKSVMLPKIETEIWVKWICKFNQINSLKK